MIKQIWIDELDEDSIKALEQAVKVNYFGYEVKHIIEEVAHLRMQLWLGKDGDKCYVVLTKLTTHPGGKELTLWSVGGRGYTKNLSEIYTTLKTFAMKENCRWMTGFVDRKGFSKLYTMFEPLKKYGLWIKEINDVPE